MQTAQIETCSCVMNYWTDTHRGHTRGCRKQYGMKVDLHPGSMPLDTSVPYLYSIIHGCISSML